MQEYFFVGAISDDDEPSLISGLSCYFGVSFYYYEWFVIVAESFCDHLSGVSETAENDMIFDGVEFSLHFSILVYVEDFATCEEGGEVAEAVEGNSQAEDHDDD